MSPQPKPTSAKPLPKLERGYTWTEEWRRICEAREVLSWPLERRRRYLEAVEKARGPTATAQLKDDMTKEFERIKNERKHNQHRSL